MKEILIVDDCSAVRQLVKTTLDTSVYKIIEAQNGEKAIELARKHKPDLIIMDIAMPGEIDGIEATRRIKNNPQTNKCQIIILSGSRDKQRKEGLKAGATDFFIKPFSPLDLITKVDRILEN
jgi:two-component system, OmpR family, phosphate regulon response regulator PhoB